MLGVGAGFTGSEIASACRERGIEVTVAERGPAPLVGALGGTLAKLAAAMHRNHGVDLRTGVTVTALRGDGNGRFTGADLSDGSRVEADVCVVALGAVRNVEWLAESGLAAGPRGIACDAGCRAFNMYGIVTDDVFVAGDVSRFPHPLFGYGCSLEHWGNAVEQAEVAAHNMVSPGPLRRPHLAVPTFWSTQFGLNIKSVGVPTYSDHVVHRPGLSGGAPSGGGLRLPGTDHRRGHRRHGQVARLLQAPDGTAFRSRPPGAADRAIAADIVGRIPSDVPDPSGLSHGPTVALTGRLPDRRLTVVQPTR